MYNLVMLDEQEEKLKNIGKGLEKINSDTKIAKKTLKNMDKVLGIFPKFWKNNHVPGLEHMDLVKKNKQNNQQKSVSPEKVRKVSKNSNLKFSVEHKPYADGAREGQININLNRISEMVGVLHNDAKIIGEEVQKQNDIIDETLEYTATTTIAVNDANKCATKML